VHIQGIDHFVLTVKSIDKSCRFYDRVLGMRVVEFGGGRKALAFSTQKINLHEAGREFEPKAQTPTPGSGDFCLIADGRMEDIVSRLRRENVVIEQGPIARTGAMGRITSVYFRDPDRNLVEVAIYENPAISERERP